MNMVREDQDVEMEVWAGYGIRREAITIGILISVQIILGIETSRAAVEHSEADSLPGSCVEESLTGRRKQEGRAVHR